LRPAFPGRHRIRDVHVGARLRGGGGDDSYTLDDAGDLVAERPGEGVDTVRSLLAVYSLAALPELEKLIFIGTGPASLTGNDRDNTITGGGGDALAGRTGWSAASATMSSR
jgi:hypothetical protein